MRAPRREFLRTRHRSWRRPRYIPRQIQAVVAIATAENQIDTHVTWSENRTDACFHTVHSGISRTVVRFDIIKNAIGTEVMLAAGVAGTVISIMVANEALVEQDQPLILIKPD